MSQEKFDGGYLCGAIRIQVVGTPQTVVYCHCGDCRRSSGAPVTTFVGCATEQVRMLRDEPKTTDA